MKKLLLMLCAAVIGFCPASAQQNENIHITPYVSPDLGLPGTSGEILEQRITRMVVSNGFGSLSGEFLLTADAQIVSKEVTPTVPPRELVKVEVTLYIVGVRERIIVGEETLTVSYVGSATNEAAVFAGAFAKINPRSPQVRRFMMSAREKIIDYYAQRVPTLLAQAQAFADMAEYDKALAVLATVPTCLPEYPLVAEKMVEANRQMLDKFAATALQEAKGKMALRDWEGALDALLYVDPLSSRFPEAEAMVKKIDQTLTAQEQAKLQAKLDQVQWNREMAQKAHDDAVMLRKMELDNAQKNAQESPAVEENKATAVASTKSWLLGKLSSK